MTIHLLNCFTCNSRLGETKTGLLCLLVETDQGLVLVDTGLGLDDYAHPTWFTQLFRVITQMPFDPQEAAVNQIRRLGFRPEDARHIILTHMHFDHCGGLPDFPWAIAHVHRREYEAFVNRPRNPFELAYVRQHIEQTQDWAFYELGNEKWFGFDAIRLPFTPQMWLRDFARAHPEIRLTASHMFLPFF